MMFQLDSRLLPTLQPLPLSVLSTLEAAVAAPAHLVIVGGGEAQRLALLSEILDKIDERRDAAFVYDPTGRLTAQFYTSAHHDIQITPLDLATCPWHQRQLLYAEILAAPEPLGIRVLKPQDSPESTWNVARWISKPSGWVFLTHAPMPAPSVLRTAGVELTAIALRAADIPPRHRRVWLVFDEPPFLPPHHLPFAYLAPALRRHGASGLRTVLTLGSRDTLDGRYGVGAADALASEPHSTLLLPHTNPGASF